MRKIVFAAAALTGAALCLSAVNAGTLIPVPPVPNSVSTNVYGINDSNTITGFYQTSDGLLHGFVGSVSGDYQTFDYPTGDAQGMAISNDGYVVGYANPSSDNQIFGDAIERKPNGTVVPITMGHNPLDGQARAIVKNQKSTGEYWVLDESENLTIHGFYAKGTKYKSDLTLPLTTTRTRPRGMNDKGEVVGYYFDSGTSNYPGFVLIDGAVTAAHYPDPNAYYTFLEGVNDKGQIAGSWQTKDGTEYHAFLYDLHKNAFNLINVPGSTVSGAGGINKAGAVAIAADNGSFIYCAKAKACPKARNAIHVSDEWIPASHWTGQSVICKDRCVGPAHKTVTLNPADRTKLLTAINKDPALLAERRMLGLH